MIEGEESHLRLPFSKTENTMKIINVLFAVTDWSNVVPVEHKGETGTSFWRVVEAGNVRVRVVEFSPNFKSDHYCSRGHVLFVLEGDHIIKLKDGTQHTLTAGMSFQTADDEANPHLAMSNKGGRVFIVD
jgi:hypothetical protein